MDRIFFINLFARLLMVACPVVAFRFARRSLRPWQGLVLCAAAGVASNVLLVTAVVVSGIMWVPSIGTLVSDLARAAGYNAAFGFVFGVIGVWRRVASTSRLILIGLVMVAAVDVIHIVVDPMFGLPTDETRPMMLFVALVVGALIYVRTAGAERQLSSRGGTRT